MKGCFSYSLSPKLFFFRKNCYTRVTTKLDEILGSHDGDRKNYIFWNVTPCNLIDVKEERTAFVLSFFLVCCAYSSILMMEAIYSFDTSADLRLLYWTNLMFVSSVHRSQWPRGLGHELSSLARTLGSRVRIPLEAWMSVCVYSVFVLGSGLATG
jgi:hypothetical protein